MSTGYHGADIYQLKDFQQLQTERALILTAFRRNRKEVSAWPVLKHVTRIDQAFMVTTALRAFEKMKPQPVRARAKITQS